MRLNVRSHYEHACLFMNYERFVCFTIKPFFPYLFTVFLVCFALHPHIDNHAGQSPVDQCFRPKSIKNADIQIHTDAYGIVAVFTCHHGYRFSAGGFVRTVMCFDNKWNIDIDDCEGQ